MELKGKKAVFLGDSITEGHGTSGPDKIYLNLLKTRCGLSQVVNYGIGGTRIAKQTRLSENSQHDLNFVSRVEEMDKDADLVVVFGGTNDYGHGDAPIGEMSDRTDETFCGACHVLMEKLIDRYPTAQIVIMTPLHRQNETNLMGDGSKTKPAGTLYDYVQIIRKTAEYYALPVLDLFALSGIQPELEVIRGRYCPDGLHPNDAGHVRIAERLESFLKLL